MRHDEHLPAKHLPAKRPPQPIGEVRAYVVSGWYYDRERDSKSINVRDTIHSARKGVDLLTVLSAHLEKTYGTSFILRQVMPSRIKQPIVL